MVKGWVLPSNQGGEGGAEVRELSADPPENPEEFGTAAAEEGRDDLRHGVLEGVEVECPEGVVTTDACHVAVGAGLGGRGHGREVGGVSREREREREKTRDMET